MSTNGRKEISANVIKVWYRLNYTRTQAALALGISKDNLQKKINKGELGINFENGEERISRVEIERHLRSKTVYARGSNV